MLKPYVGRGLLLALLAAAVVALAAGPATADTIYLKNGRVIRSSSVRVEGEKVVFVQYAGEQTIPLAMVDRIEEDANTEPEPTVVVPPPADEQAGTAGAAAAAQEGADVPPEQTRDYWQEQVRAVVAERAQVELTIGDLKRTEQAFLFSHRSTADTRKAIEEAEARLGELDKEMQDLQAEARRLNIPPGWLRVEGGGEGGDGGGAPGGTGGMGGSGGPGGGGQGF